MPEFNKLVAIQQAPTSNNPDGTQNSLYMEEISGGNYPLMSNIILLTADNLRVFIQALHCAQHVSREIEICELELSFRSFRSGAAIFCTHPSGYVWSKNMGHMMVQVPRDVLAHPSYNLYFDGVQYTISEKEPPKPRRLRMGEIHDDILVLLTMNPHGLTDKQIMDQMRKVTKINKATNEVYYPYEHFQINNVCSRRSELTTMGKVRNSGHSINDEISGKPNTIWIKTQIK